VPQEVAHEAERKKDMSNETKMKTITTAPARPLSLHTQSAIYLIKSILEQITIMPDKIQVVPEQLGYSTVSIEIRADATDYGKVLGEKGDHLRALKTICKLISDKSREKIELSLLEMPGGSKQNLAPFSTNAAWPKEKIQTLLQALFELIFDGGCRVVISDGSNGRTAVDVLVSERENRRTCEWVHEKLDSLIKAIGLRNGRLVAFNVIQDEAALQHAIAA
jgi:predicted RNA-binding protein YlqC (UPF0109 family)